VRKEIIYYLNEFVSLKKRYNEFVVDFNRRFNKIYNKIPRDIKPSQPETKVTYVGAFDDDFSMVLRERRSPTFLVMQDDVIDIEGNMIAFGKMKQRLYQVDKKKSREECSTYDPNKDSQEGRIEEMSILIRNLSNKMSIFEIENKNENKYPQEGGVRNPNQFKRHFNPQLMRKERRNEEQTIQPPVKNNNDNNLVEEWMDEEYVYYPK
jgi:hypothetical protein